MMNAMGTTKNSEYQMIDGRARANFGPRHLRRSRSDNAAVTRYQAPALAFILLRMSI
jgi:hypothetical protein